MAKRTHELGDAELAVLRVLWEHGPLSVREVMEKLHDRSREVAYTTVLTFLTRLEKKGFVRSDKSGPAYVFRAKVSREQVTRTKVRGLLDELFDGAATPMLLHLIEHRDLDRDDIDRLRSLITDLDQRGT